MATYSNVLNLYNLTNKATPTTSDYIPLGDAAVTGVPLKQCTVGSLPFTSFTTTVQTTGTTAMLPQNGYIANGASLITYNLPTTIAVGQMIRVTGLGAGGWTITQSAGQNIQLGNVSTTAGTGGSLSSSNQFDNILMECTVANTSFAILSAVGNPTVV